MTLYSEPSPVQHVLLIWANMCIWSPVKLTFLCGHNLKGLARPLNCYPPINYGKNKSKDELTALRTSESATGAKGQTANMPFVDRSRKAMPWPLDIMSHAFVTTWCIKLKTIILTFVFPETNGGWFKVFVLKCGHFSFLLGNKNRMGVLGHKKALVGCLKIWVVP